MDNYTVFNAIEDIEELPVGTVLDVKKEGGSTGRVLSYVYHQGKKLGAIAVAEGGKNGVKILLTDTVALTPEKQNQMPDSWTAKVVGSGSVFHGQHKKALAISFAAPWDKPSAKTAKQSDITLVFKVHGATSQNPGKVKVIQSLKNGDDVYLSMKSEEKNDEIKVVMEVNGERAGIIAPASAANENDYKVLLELIQNGVSLEAKAFEPESASYKVMIPVGGADAAQAAASAAKTATKDIKEKIAQAGICPMDRLNEIEEYCFSLNVPPETMKLIFETYREYPVEDQCYIKEKVDTKFQDSEGYIFRAIAAMLTKRGVILLGESGCGKNNALETLAWILQRPYVDFNLNGNTDKYELLGCQAIDAKETDAGQVMQNVVFIPAPLVTAMERGYICNLDEINTAMAAVLCAVHPVLDDRRYINLANYGLVTADDNFLCVGTMNVGYAGTQELSKAIKGRVSMIKFKPPVSIEKILRERCGSFASAKDIKTCERVFQKILSIKKDPDTSSIDVDASAREFVMALEQVSVGLPLLSALQNNIVDKVFDESDWDAIRELVEMNCPK